MVSKKGRKGQSIRAKSYLFTMQTHGTHVILEMIYNMSYIVFKHFVCFITCFKTRQCEQFEKKNLGVLQKVHDFAWLKY